MIYLEIYSLFVATMAKGSRDYPMESGVRPGSRIYKESEDEVEEDSTFDLRRPVRGNAPLIVREVPGNLGTNGIIIDPNPKMDFDGAYIRCFRNVAISRRE